MQRQQDADFMHLFSIYFTLLYLPCLTVCVFTVSKSVVPWILSWMSVLLLQEERWFSPVTHMQRCGQCWYGNKMRRKILVSNWFKAEHVDLIFFAGTLRSSEDICASNAFKFWYFYYSLSCCRLSGQSPHSKWVVNCIWSVDWISKMHFCKKKWKQLLNILTWSEGLANVKFVTFH